MVAAGINGEVADLEIHVVICDCNVTIRVPIIVMQPN